MTIQLDTSNVQQHGKTVNVVLDIDDVLCITDVAPEYRLFFLRKGLILIAADTPHYFFPGVAEFLRALYSTENVRVSYFSSAPKERNEALIPQLLQNIFSPSNPPKSRIYSEAHLTKRPKIDIPDQFPYGHNCKNLNTVIDKEDLIENASLIDDNKIYAHPQQTRNFLYVPAVDLHCAIENQNGEIPHSSNRIYYLAGLLFTALAQSRNIPKLAQESAFWRD